MLKALLRGPQGDNTDVFEPALSSLTSLTYLSNGLTAISEFIGQLTSLWGLDTHSNQLTSLPESISGLTKLSYLNIADTDLTKLPQAVSDMTNLTSLPYEGKGEFDACQTPSPTTEDDSSASATPLAHIVAPLAGAFVAAFVFAAVVIGRRDRATKAEAKAVPYAPDAIPYAPDAIPYALDAIPTAVPYGRAVSD
ncbi:Leucine-rich repeat-containing protein 40 [Hondaea fermentalgiana]|uniref:Leucine-rich repeat-containing protein 40 n=1 Tax=Hondaea fermentalgiana TaxID=2315210 RepID=A0A2R5GYM6_9STRA|nr:Leucine-rich repeat-containing protein 40 [Hondaea fermentalgiana]|eukprot:GBG33094.1 Leucine-rich repeat-containing protein 40 [Hondaea fermentalgiana]